MDYYFTRRTMAPFVGSNSKLPFAEGMYTSFSLSCLEGARTPETRIFYSRIVRRFEKVRACDANLRDQDLPGGSQSQNAECRAQSVERVRYGTAIYRKE